MMFTGDGHGLHHSFVILRSWNKKFHKLECFRSAQVSLALIALMITLWSLKDSAREPQHWPSGDGVTPAARRDEIPPVYPNGRNVGRRRSYKTD